MSKTTNIERDGKPEDAADIAAVEAVYADDTEEMLPSEMVDRLVAGENPIRVWREHRGMTGRDLADAVDVRQSYISQIETGKREGTIDVLRRIALALEITLADLYPA